MLSKRNTAPRSWQNRPQRIGSEPKLIPLRSPLPGNEGEASRDQDAPSICLVSKDDDACGRYGNDDGSTIWSLHGGKERIVTQLSSWNWYRS